jgi:isocitrate/isopropylmalate dehydrogenase
MVDMTILRENTEGLYYSLLKRASNRAQGLEDYTIPEIDFPDLKGEVAYDPRPISSHGTERLVKMGFEIAQTRNGAHVSIKVMLPEVVNYLEEHLTKLLVIIHQ